MTTLNPPSAFAASASPRSTLPWWLFLITGFCWIVVSWIVLRFTYTSVNAISILAGLVMLAAGIAEGFNAFTAPGWRWLHAILAALFLITSTFAFINPGRTFIWLAAFVGWYLLIKGFADIVLAFVTKDVNDAWWLGLIVGILEVIIGFWAAGQFFRSAYLLVFLIALIALSRGITDIVAAFRFRKLQNL